MNVYIIGVCEVVLAGQPRALMCLNRKHASCPRHEVDSGVLILEDLRANHCIVHSWLCSRSKLSTEHRKVQRPLSPYAPDDVVANQPPTPTQLQHAQQSFDQSYLLRYDTLHMTFSQNARVDASAVSAPAFIAHVLAVLAFVLLLVCPCNY